MFSLITFIVCWLFFCSKIVFSFSSNSFLRSTTSSSNLILFSTSYEQMLEQARLKKLQPQQALKPKIEPPAKKEIKDVPKQVSRPRKANASGLPFDDATYSHMKYVIEKLTGKLRSDISLSPEELIRFKKSVEEIIADANGDEETIVETLDSVDSIPSSGSSTSSPSSSNAFAAFKGLRSTWEVKGADKMSTEEYYKAVNARIAEVRNLRKSIGEDTTTDSYLKSLSAKPNAAA